LGLIACHCRAGGATRKIGLGHNPTTVWTVPDAFRTIYSHAFEVRDAAKTLYISGQFGVAPDGTLREDFVGQLNQAMDNVEALLAEAGMGKDNAVKITYFLTRREDLPLLGEKRRERWARSKPPAVTVIVVAALARPEYLVEVEAIAVA
jgi:enamine deaminase RidA (YjgF/YER057c/UK114 family)